MNSLKRKLRHMLSKGEEGQTYAYGGGGVMVVLVIVVLILLLR
jgi:hypothetical protein